MNVTAGHSNRQEPGQSPGAAFLRTLGYQTVFDICRCSRRDFLRHAASREPASGEHASLDRLYTHATRQARTLRQLYRRVQAHRDPVAANIPKLGIVPAPRWLGGAVNRTLGEAADLDQQFPERSEQGYAVPGSVESLFSPGRYLVELYGIARTLHPAGHPLALDQRRPDLATLALSETNLNQVLSSLEILLGVLQARLKPGTDAQETLARAVYPMTLPYRHDLVRIREALTYQKTSLPELWSIQFDTLRQAVQAPESTHQPVRRFAPRAAPAPASLVRDAATDAIAEARWTREQLGLAPEMYARLIAPLTDAQLAEDFGGTDGHPAIYQSMNALADFTRKTGLSLDETLALTAQSGLEVPSTAVTVESIFYPLGATTASTTAAYGATLVCNSGPLFVYTRMQSRHMGWNGLNRPQQYRTVDQLIRLQRQTGLSFEQLDWILSNALRAGSGATPNAPALIDAQGLYALACCVALQQRFRLEVDACVALMGELNLHARKGQKSFYDRLFNMKADDAPITPDIQIDVSPESSTPALRAALASGLGVDAQALYRIVQLVTGQAAPAKITFSAETAAGCYRLSTLPRLFSWTLAECLAIWDVMPGMDWRASVSGIATLETFAIVERTRLVATWMADSQLTPAKLATLLNREVSPTATPAMFNFLSNIAETVGTADVGTAAVLRAERVPRLLKDANSAPSGAVRSRSSRGTASTSLPACGPHASSASASARRAAPLPLASLCKLIGAAFGLKPNVTAQVVTWHDATAVAPDRKPYAIDTFWGDVIALFDGGGAVLDDLNAKPNLVWYCHSLSRYALLAQWLKLDEQALTMLVTRPDYLDTVYPAAQPPEPTLDLLIVLTRLQAWGQRVTGGASQGLRFFPDFAATTDQTAAAERLAALHGWDSEQTLRALKALFADQVPGTFAEVHALENMMRMATRLGVDITTVAALRSMADGAPAAEAPELLASVADDLTGAVLAASS